MSDFLHRRLHGDGEPPIVMGILNVTPDSFSDGALHSGPDSAMAHARRMVEEGAEIIDVGPESTRPGALPVSANEQMQRAVPVIEGLVESDPSLAISIDTRSAEVAESALDAGAVMVNDVSALRDDPRMAEVVARKRAWVVLMHRRGDSRSMQLDGGPAYDNVICEVIDFLQERVGWAVARGVNASRIVVDPGIGFGKRVEHNLLMVREIERFTELGQPVLIGASRKRFIGMTLGIEDAKERDAASFACAALAGRAGASIIRGHAVKGTVQAARLGWATRHA